MEKQPPERTHLFLVRLWIEELGEGQTEWRGRAQNITSGDAAYFRDWDGLVATLGKLLEAKPTEERQSALETE